MTFLSALHHFGLALLEVSAEHACCVSSDKSQAVPDQDLGQSLLATLQGTMLICVPSAASDGASQRS